MRIPSSVNKNTLKTYYPIEIVRKKYPISDLERWDEQIPKPLHELCVECIAKQWKENPILDEIVLLIDRYLLLDILPPDLPLELTIPKIPDEIYWKKRYLERWPKTPANVTSELEDSGIVRNHDVRKLSIVCGSNGTGSDKEESVVQSRKSSRAFTQISKASSKQKSEFDEDSDGSKNQGVSCTWKECYIEMHIKEYLEKLKPEEYDPEKIKHLSDLCGEYVKSVTIDQMQCSQNSANKIPFNSVLCEFRKLKELSLCFKQTYVEKEFSWNILNTSSQDITLLSKGLQLLNLKVLRIRNSDIDCEKVVIILKSILKHDMEILDFSHCKIGNKGFLAISKFLLENPLKQIELSNNRGGTRGYEALAYAISQPACVLEKLNLRLNSIFDEAGNIFMEVLKKHGKTIMSLNISGCGFSALFRISEMLEMNKTLQCLDISNNNIGNETGMKILQALQANTTLKKLDVRMCKISSKLELTIHQQVQKNTKNKLEILTPKLMEDSDGDYKWKDELIAEINNAF